MRPLKVTLQAFGSYGKRTEIDLTMPNQNLFLITGDTGAGKSTIFDGIVFALYGEASSENNKKSGVVLQSQFADLGVKPFVELSFSELEGEEEVVYTVCRTPKHFHPKRGGGFREIGESVELILPSGLAYDGKIKDINQKLEEIVGLTKAQFMQVAMIAQGEFMALVRSDSKTRKEIFRKLFNTEKYQKIVDVLADRCREGRGELAQMRTVFQTEAAHVEIPDSYEKKEELQALKQRIVTAESLPVTVMEAFLEEVESLCGLLYEEGKLVQDAWLKAKEKRDAAKSALDKGTGLQKVFLQLDQALQELAHWEEAAESMEAARVLSGKIDGAYDVKGVYDRYQDVISQVEELKKKAQIQKDMLPELVMAWEEASAKELEAGLAKDQELIAYSALEERVRKALEAWDKMKEAQTACQEAVKNCKKMEKIAGLIKKQKEDLGAAIQSYRKEEANLSQVGETLAQSQARLNTIGGFLDQVVGLEGIAASCLKKQKQYAKALKAYEGARTVYQIQQGEYMLSQQAYFDEQAGLLAKELKQGMPCPVCGSLDHPHPHVLEAGKEILTREALEQKGQEVESLRLDVEKKAGLASSGKTAYEEEARYGAKLLGELQEKLALFLPDLKEESGLSRIKERLMGLKNQEEEGAKALSEKQARLEEVKKLLQKAEDGLNQLGQKEVQAGEALTGARELLASREATLKGLESSKEYESAEAAKGILLEAEQKKLAKEAAYNQAAKEARQAKTKKENGETLLNQYRKELPEKEEELAKRKSAYEESMEKLALPQEEWLSLVAAHKKEEAKKLRDWLAEVQQKKAAAMGQKQVCQETIGAQERPDLEALASAAHAAEEVETDLREKLDQKAGEYKNNDRILKSLQPVMEERKQVAALHDRTNSLYKRLSGNVTGGRMDLETFVQRYYLERILHAANARFAKMSAGQFELRMYDLEKAGEGKNKGLDLMVYSNVTGKERDVKSLSGGETFMAALSLAMGIADQIQAGSGAVNLDIMFIDEGFGSLSDEVRNQAVRVLQQMAEGSKLIGLISHVTELKHQIEDQLIITKDEEGSHPTWQIS